MRLKKLKKDKIPIENIDIRYLLEDCNINYWEKGKNVKSGWIGVQCPFCDDNRNHLGINVSSKTISCWKCGTTGTILKYFIKKLNSFSKAMEFIEKNIPKELRRFDEQIHGKSKVEKVLLPEGVREGLSQKHKEYLIGRKFNPDILTKVFQLHHTCDDALFRWKIIIPIVKNYTLVSWTTVDIRDNVEARYVHQPEQESIIPVKNLLFGEELTDGHNIIVTEGLFDAWRFSSGAVPTWGVKFTEKQVKALIRYRNVKVVGDGDKDGWRFNKKLTSALAPYTNVKYYDLPKDIDPDKLTKEEINFIKNN